MSDSAEPKRARRPRRHDPAALRRSALERIGSELDETIRPPVPPGLGEGLLERAARDGSERDRQIAGLLGQLLERSAASADRIEGISDQVNRMDEKIEQMNRRLDGVAYQEDIKSFMSRDEIERKIKEANAEVKADVASLRKIGWGLASTIIVTFAGLLVKLILSSAHITV